MSITSTQPRKVHSHEGANQVLEVTPQVNQIADALHTLLDGKPRVLVAMCGGPASGKSTLSAEVARRMNGQRRKTVVVPMDGFHLDNAILEERGLRPRKGAPETFDAQGFVNLVSRISQGGEVFYPTFDRARDISIAGSGVVPHDAEVVLVEGNYLMFDEDPWRSLAAIWDYTVRLDVPLADLRARLIQRWLNHGLSRAAATRRAESNDIPNSERVIAKALPVDLTLTNQ